MILNENKQEVISNFSGEESSFTIDATSSHIFEILRSKQYSNGKESLVRELIANAKDSHIEAGKRDVPIRVWLNENYLTIQDYGVGLSPERIRDVYLCFGKSTKRTSNDQQGCYGIGAKSFFSYASAASITSIYDGIKREYSAYLNETNVGAFKLITETPTDECNGVSVKIPIQPSHFHEFRTYVRKYGQFMSPPPEILGDNSPQPLIFPEVIMEGNGWKIFKRNQIHNFNILLDEIPYNYHLHHMPSDVTFIFNNGELTPSATREALLKDEKNDEVIKKAVEKFRAELENKTQEKIKNSNDFVEVIQAIETSGKIISLHTQKEWEWGEDKTTLKYPYSSDNKMLRFHTRYGTANKVQVCQYDADLKSNAFVLVPDDYDYYEVRGYTTRKLKYYKEKNNVGTLYLVRSSHGVPDSMVVKLEDIKIKMNYASTPKTPKPKAKKKDYVYAKMRGRTKRVRFDLDPSLVNDPIRLYSTDINITYHYKHINNFLSRINHRYVYELTEKDAKLVKSHPKWMTIQEYIHENLTKDFTKEELELEYKRVQANNAYGSYQWLKDHISKEHQLGFQKGKLTDLQDEILNFIAENGEINLDKPPSLFDKYPMLNLLDCYNVGNIPGKNNYSYNPKVDYKHVVEYVQFINEKNEKNEKESVNVYEKYQG